METKWFVPAGQQLEDIPLRERSIALHISSKEFDRITAHLTRQSRAQRAIDEEIAINRKKKEVSRKIIKSWPDCLESKLEQKADAFLEKKRRIEEERARVFWAAEQKKAEYQKKYVEQVRKSLYLQTSTAKSLTSALCYGQVEIERKKQIEMKRLLEEHEKQEEKKYAQKVREGALAEKMEKMEAEKMRRQKITEIKKLCYQQILDNSENKKKEKEMRQKLEADDNIRAVEEMEFIEKQSQEEAFRLRQGIRKSCDDFFEHQTQIRKKLKEEDDMQEKVMNIYQETKKRIDCTRKQREQDKLAAKFKRAADAGEKNEAKRKAQEEKENQIIKRANDERDQLELERFNNDQEKLRLYREYCNKCQKEHLEEEEHRKAIEHEFQKWDMLNRFKSNETMKQDLEKSRTSKLKEAKELKAAQKSQSAKDYERHKREADDTDWLKSSMESYENKDKQFFGYAEEVRDLARREAWGTYAIENVVEKYKRENALVPPSKFKPCVDYNTKTCKEQLYLAKQPPGRKAHKPKSDPNYGRRTCKKNGAV